MGIGRGTLRAEIRHRAQRRCITVLKQLPGRYLDAGTIGARGDLEQLNGVRSHFQEIRRCADAFQIQYLPKYLGQCHFRRGGGLDKQFVGDLYPIRHRQRGTIELTVGRQGQSIQPHPRRRYHVFGHILSEERPQCLA